LFKLSCRAIAAIAALVLLSPVPGQAQPATIGDRQNLINWYYSASFGTGVYTAGDRSLTVVQLPYSRELKSDAADGTGLRFKLSTTFGF
jgi:hypothetical protein